MHALRLHGQPRAGAAVGPKASRLPLGVAVGGLRGRISVVPRAGVAATGTGGTGGGEAAGVGAGLTPAGVAAVASVLMACREGDLGNFVSLRLLLIEVSSDRSTRERAANRKSEC